MPRGYISADRKALKLARELTPPPAEKPRSPMSRPIVRMPELLKQIAELRREVRRLHGEVQELKQALCRETLHPPQ